MRIFLDSRGNLVFYTGGTFVQRDVEGNTSSDYCCDEPEVWNEEYQPRLEFTSEEVYSIIETLIEVLEKK